MNVLSRTFSFRRDWWRYRAPLSPSEVRRTERWLATARVALSIAAIVALWMEPKNGLSYSQWLYWLLTVYLVHGVVVMLLLRIRPESTAAFRLVVHSVDILWPTLIAMFTTGQGGPFFLFFMFVITAAAYRWGVWETLATAAATVALLWGEAVLVRLGLEQLADTWLRFLHLPRLGVRHLDLEQLFISSVYVMVLGLLLGYMSENQKRLRAERAVITRVLGSARVEAGLTGTLEAILGEILNMYAAERVLTASQEVSSYRVFLGEVARTSEGPSALRWREAVPETETVYRIDPAVDALYVERGNRSDTVILDREGRRLRDIDTAFLDDLSQVESFQSMVTVAFSFGREWSGRTFVFNPQMIGDREEELRFLQEFAHQVGPAVYNVYLMRRLRERAGALERSRFARELHDGAIQSLIGVEMQLDVLRRQAATQVPAVNSELSRIQQLLREEVLKLRELMQEMKSFEVDSDRLLGFLSDTVERFRRETGISAEFISEVQRVELPQKVCRELARIVQESLVNVRKHSGAQHVLVRLAPRAGSLQLSIEDDGKGFAFSGKLSQAELEAAGKGPAVIRDRVRLLAGELTVESNPGQGARLEVRIPPARQASHG